MFWFVPYISDPVWNFTYVAYSLTSSKPAKNTKGRCFWHTLSDNDIVMTDNKILCTRQKPIKRTIYLWKNVDIVNIKIDTNTLSSNILKHEHDLQKNIENIWNQLKQGIDNIINKNRYEYKLMNCSVDTCRITYIIFLIWTKYWKGLCVIISKLRSGMYIFLLYSLTSA